jgi:GT2 family glycosyltransferase
MPVQDRKVSVLLLNWNGLRFLGPCIRSLMQQTSSRHELILIDNGSDDGSVQYVESIFPSVRILENKRNLGFAEGNNIEGYCIANCAAAVLYRRQTLELTGHFDPDFWSDWEDHDLGFRLWLTGFKNIYTTKTRVVHVGGRSFGRELSKDRYVRIIRNMLVTYLKNYDSWNLVTRFFFLFWVMLPLRHFVSIIVYELARLRARSRQGMSLMSREAYLALPLAYLAFIR